MSEVQFLVSEPDDRQASASAAPPDPAPSALRRQLPTTGATLCWAGAAAISIGAPFRDVFEVGRSPDGSSSGFSLDGWGRYHSGDSLQDFAFAHGDRFGIPVAGCGVLLVAMALLVAFVAWTVPRWAATDRGARLLRRALPAAGVAAGGVLFGVALSAFLSAQTERDLLLRSAVSDTGYAPVPFLYVDTGPFPWLVAAAAALAMLGAFAAAQPAAAPAEPAAVEPRRSDPRPAPQPPSAPRPAPAADTAPRLAPPDDRSGEVTAGEEELLR